MVSTLDRLPRRGDQTVASLKIDEPEFERSSNRDRELKPLSEFGGLPSCDTVDTGYRGDMVQQSPSVRRAIACDDGAMALNVMAQLGEARRTRTGSRCRSAGAEDPPLRASPVRERDEPAGAAPAGCASSLSSAPTSTPPSSSVPSTVMRCQTRDLSRPRRSGRSRGTRGS